MNPGRRAAALCSTLAALAGTFPAPVPLAGQEPRNVPVIVDGQGVMRWTETGEEVALFGVNYSTPFAHGYRAHDYIGADRRQAIDIDVDHMARLGLDAFRIHVWDRQISDRQGNLVENEHLDLLDYLIHRLSERGIRTVLTPIAWWPPGYPEPSPETDGLSDLFDKGGMATEPSARAPQANYLRQFIRHVNPYRGVSYRDDPDIIAFEIFNEPSHPGGPEATTDYIDEMVAALRDAGLEKPIFYNISQGNSESHGRSVCAADIQGVTYQWYPTGLVRNRTLGGNMLPNVDRYTSPYTELPECRDKALLVYEFDAADVGGSYMYPAMARSFRGAGVQWATQFAYDPVFIAYANTEYQTHFLNLVYTPSKAISFLIAGEAFRRTPLGADAGTYPASARFGDIRVSYEEDLSELVSDTAFFHSNTTDTRPPAPAALRRVAGVGSSPVVEYDGTGSYFLDRLDDGVWRLEVYPDAAWVEDPYARPSLEREASRVVWRTRDMRIDLPDLGPRFEVRPLNDGNPHRPSVEGGRFGVRPGVYLLNRAERDASDWRADRVVAGRALGRFFAPPSSDAPTRVLHRPMAEAIAGAPLDVRVQVVAREPVDSVTLQASRVGAFGRPVRVRMEPGAGFSYDATLAEPLMREGLVEYSVVVWDGEDTRTFPGDHAGSPRDWDFTGADEWRVAVVPGHAPVVLFDAERDLDDILYPHRWGYVPFRTDVVPGATPGEMALRGVVQDLEPEPHHFAIRTVLDDGERHRLGAAGDGGTLRILARAATREAGRMEVALVQRDGSAWGTTLDLTDEWREITVPLASLERIPLTLLPRPYPQFLPYQLEADVDAAGPSVLAIDGLQFAIGVEHFGGGASAGEHGFEVERVVFDPDRGR